MTINANFLQVWNLISGKFLFRSSACSCCGLLQSGISKRRSLEAACTGSRRRSRLRPGEQTHKRRPPARQFSFLLSSDKCRQCRNNYDHDQAPRLSPCDILSSRCETQKRRTLLPGSRVLHSRLPFPLLSSLQGSPARRKGRNGCGETKCRQLCLFCLQRGIRGLFQVSLLLKMW